MKRDTTPALCTNRILEFCTLLCLYRSAEQQSSRAAEHPAEITGPAKYRGAPQSNCCFRYAFATLSFLPEACI